LESYHTMTSADPGGEGDKKSDGINVTVTQQNKMGQGEQRRGHCTMQQPALFVPCEAYGSSLRATGPHTEGTSGSFVVLQYRIRLALASLTLIRGRARSSRNR